MLTTFTSIISDDLIIIIVYYERFISDARQPFLRQILHLIIFFITEIPSIA